MLSRHVQFFARTVYRLSSPVHGRDLFCASRPQLLISIQTAIKPIQPLRPSLANSSRYSTDSSSFDPSYSTTNVAQLVKSARIVVLMKGDPTSPSCGFSNAVCRILEMHGVLDKASSEQQSLFTSYDVLADQDLRQAAKTFSDWPTFPQVYFDGEFVGGCDILLEMHKSGQLTEQLIQLGIGSKLASDNSGEEAS